MRFSTATFALATLVASAAAHPHAPVVNHEDIVKRHNVARELETVHTAKIPHHIRFPGTHDLDDVPEWLEYDGPDDDDKLVAPAYSDDWTVPEDQDYVKNITKVNPRDLEELEARATRKSGLAWSSQVPKGLSQFNGSTTFGVYNWGTYWIPELKQRGIKYFPMLKSYEKRESFRQTVTQGYGNGGWVMAMNEVNHNQQAPMDPGRANWMIQTYLLPLKKAKNGKPGFKLVCPSVANGPTGIAWYDKFYKNHRATFDQCDAISVHYYGVEHQKVIDWMQMFYDRYKKPIWLTEYGCNSWSGKYCTATYARTFVQKIGSFCQSKWWCQTHMLFGTFQNTNTYSGVSKVNGMFSSSSGSLSEIGRIFKSL